MTSKTRIALLAACASALAFSGQASAQRAETVTQAVVFEMPQCLLTPESAISSEQTKISEVMGPAVALALADIAGDLVKSGANALGEALETASQEHGFVAEGTAGIRFGIVDPSPESGPQAVFQPTARCIGLYVPSGKGSVANIFQDPTLTRNGTLAFDWKDDDVERANITNEFIAMGMTTAPLVYAEGMVLPGKEAFVFRPTLIWYPSPLKGAPKTKETSAELHLLFAVPGYDAAKTGLGTGFAGARLILPKVRPGSVLDWDQLRGSRSVWLPLRPTAGTVDATLQGINASRTLVATRTAELAKAERALAAARRAQARKPGAEATEAVTLAEESRDQSQTALDQARAAAPGKASTSAGATNVQFRFVVVRDQNKLGTAIAKMLKDKAEVAGKSVTEALTPKPDWATTDTGYLSAIVAGEQKQKLYDDAVAAGDSSAMLAAGQELRLAKAKANEAAVSAKRALPFPELLNGL